MDLILEKFNLGGFGLINDLAGHNVWLDRFMIFAADKMGYLLIVALLVLFWKKDYFKKVVFVSLGSALIARFVFVSVIRYFLYSPRPFLVLEHVNILMNHELESSFPSGHASFYFALAMGVYLYNKKIGYIYLILAGLVGFARIFVSVHWPLDILAGAVLGTTTAYIMKRFVASRIPALA
ncbi:MAG: phosphatase PAP2 family protein [Candidatus Yanofskybacteria bacterium]|nr:phosphatase PAP2 family protein [Candidatus Yanofskybacteria bacterium]